MNYECSYSVISIHFSFLIKQYHIKSHRILVSHDYINFNLVVHRFKCLAIFETSKLIEKDLTFIPYMKSNLPITGKEFVCGWLAAATNIIATYPIYRISVHQVLHNEGVLTASEYTLIRKLNLRSIYRGLLPPLCQKSLNVSCMFGMYYNLHNFLRSKNVKYANNISVLALGTMETTIMPFERMQTILLNKNFNRKYKNMVNLIIRLPQEYGFREYYRGLIIVFLRNVLGNAFFFNFKHITDYHIIQQYKLPVVQSGAQFVLGGIIGGSISTLLYPLTVVKLELQKKVGTKFVSPLKATVEIYSRDKQLIQFYKGGLMNAVRAFLSWGIINTSYEFYMKLFFEYK